MFDKALKTARVRQMLANGTARTARLNAGLSLREMSAEVGVSANTLHAWENGYFAPKGRRALRYLSLLERLSREFGQ